MADQSLAAARAAVARAHIGNQDPEHVAEVTRNYRAAKQAADSRQFDTVLRGLTQIHNDPPSQAPSEDFFRAMQDVMHDYTEHRYQRLMERLGWAEEDDSQ